MKVEEFDHGTVERQILVGMALDTFVCGKIAARWKGGLFGSPVANLFGSFCVGYYRKHRKAPGKATLRNIFVAWAEDHRDEESVRNGERFWAVYQDDIERSDGHVNPEFTVDVAGKHFDEVRMASIAERSRAELDAGRPDKAREILSSYTRVELGVGSGIDLFRDMEAVDRAFAVSNDPLIRYPKATGHFFSGTLERDCFVAFCAPEKGMKSWWLMDMAWRGVMQDRRVAFFELGDQNEGQVLRRFYSRAAKHPVRSTNQDGTTWPCEVKWPVSLMPPPSGKTAGEVDHKFYSYDAPLGPKRSKSALANIVGKKGIGDTRMRISNHPAGTLGVDGMRDILDDWIQEGWVPDIVIADYADLLADPEGRRKDYREAIGQNWLMMRALSTQYHVLLATATQANRDSYDRSLITRKNISEDKRKMAHVTAMAAINVIAEEKESCQCRLSWLATREKESSWKQVVHVAGCLALANPCVLSIFP